MAAHARRSGPEEAASKDDPAKNRPQSTRDDYAACGAAARGAFAKAAPRCSRFDLRVLAAVVSVTALYSRLSDTVALTQLAAIVYGNPAHSVTGYQRDRVGAALRRLSTGPDRVVEYSAGIGRTAMAQVGLPLAETQHAGDRVTDGNTGRSRRETQVDPVAKPSTTGGHSEKVFREDFSEGGDCFAEKEDRIASWLADNLTRVEYDRWLEAVDKLRGEGIGDMVIDMAAGKTIQKGDAGPGYLLKVGRDWYSQRVGVAS